MPRFLFDHDNEYYLDFTTGKKYLSRMQAVYDNVPIENLELHYYDHLMEHLKNPVQQKPLYNMYKDRLLSLREQYDWLEFSWSGGWDSNNILHIATKEKIKFDKIITRSAGNWDNPHPYHLDSHNNIVYLKEYQKVFPDIKLYCIDQSKLAEIVCGEKDYENWLYCRHGLLNTICNLYTDYLCEYRANVSNGACVLGMHKPMLGYNKEYNLWQTWFTSHTSIGCNTFGSEYVKPIRFYRDYENNLSILQAQLAELINKFSPLTRAFKENFTNLTKVWNTNSELKTNQLIYNLPIAVVNQPKLDPLPSLKPGHNNCKKMDWYLDGNKKWEPYWEWVNHFEAKVSAEQWESDGINSGAKAITKMIDLK